MSELEKIPGVRRAFAAPFFNEFTVELPRSVKLVNAQLLKEKIIGPLCFGDGVSGIDQACFGLRYGDDLAGAD